MKVRKQKISLDTCQQKNRAELEGYVEGQTFIWITENNLTDNNQLGYEFVKAILEGKYQPNPVRRIEIPKENGKTRQLGIPTILIELFNNLSLKFYLKVNT
jgi:hypothetical protein